MEYSIEYKKDRLTEKTMDLAAEYRSKHIDSSVQGKNWLLIDATEILPIPNVTYCFTKWDKKEQIEKCQEVGAKFMMSDVCRNWEFLYFLVDCLGVSQVRIGGELGFELKDVANYCHSKGVKVRIKNPNIPDSTFPGVSPLLSFWATPQALKYWDELVDVIEFDDPGREWGLIGSYIFTKKWIGDLWLLTGEAFDEIHAETILDKMWERRVNCHRKCMKGKDCSFCESTYNLAKLFSGKSITVEMQINEN